MKPLVYIGFLLSLAILTNGCSTMKPEEFVDKEPLLILEDYFSGKTKAWGLVEDMFGRVIRQFEVDINGTWDGKILVLDEHFVFDDGEKSYRQWRITKLGAGTYEGEADDVVGLALGQSYGNALNWKYVLNLKMSGNRTIKIKFDDWMFLQSDGVLLNRAKMKKFGIGVGQISLAFKKDL